ncbi:MAG: FAD-dependent oxidoreductase, partial [Deltaproteobacteria bacterium]|nr:FAD-dependent oxidoreductase [Deltaproteobacteria bacterium]
MAQKSNPTRSLSRRTFIAGTAAAATAGGVAGWVGGQALEKRHRAPAGPFFGQRSHCHWIESAGIEDTPPLASLQGDQTADIAIVGGGYTGLSAALHLAERFPERRIVLLEGTRVGYGASGRNCGLLLPFINGAESIAHELVDAGRIDEARKVFDATSAGIGLIQELAEQRGIDCEFEPVENLMGAVTPQHEALLERQQSLFAALGLEATWLSETELRQRVAVEGYRGALTVPTSAMINPAKLATGLLALVRAAGVEVHEDSPALEIEPGTTVRVRTPRGTVRAPVLVLATNAYTHHLGFMRNQVLPIHSHSIATAPLSESQIEALSWSGREPFFDVRSFFNLFRLTADNRVLLSGGDGFYYYGGAAIDREGHPDYERLTRD